jgi:hypothetical protein
MEVYDDLRSAVTDVVRSGSVQVDDVNRFFSAEERSRFLFGPEVKRYLEGIRKQMTRHRLAELQVKTDDDEKRARAADVEAEAFQAISNFYEEFPSLIMPYVKMHQKAPPI